MASDRLLIGIVHRNAPELTQAAVNSALEVGRHFYANGGKFLGIHLIDNASGDRNISSFSPFVKLNVLVEQQPLARCWNNILENAESLGGPDTYVLVCNNDIEMLPETAVVLMKAMKANPGCMVSAASAVEEEFKAIADRIKPPAWAEVCRELLTPHPDFSCLMIQPWMWRAVGGFDPGYVGAYFEDNDFHVRLVRSGYLALKHPIPFWHKSSGTKRHSTAEESHRIEECFELNKTRFLCKFGCLPGTPEYDKLFDNQKREVT